jgi:hypothetical protein
MEVFLMQNNMLLISLMNLNEYILFVEIEVVYG